MQTRSDSGEKKHRGITIFLAEDNPADIYLLREALGIDSGTLDLNLVVARDGEQALDFIRGMGEFANAKRPDLIVLDLNLPRLDGSEVLRFVRASEALRNVPVVILTSSDSQRDRDSARTLGADWYLTKPSDLDAFLSLGALLKGYLAVGRQA